ncbi:hypothetical protein Tco_0413835 [Tanacetum coccineum]
MALLLAEERFLKIKQAVEEEQNQPENIQEQEEQAAKVSSQYWKPLILYDDDDDDDTESSIPLRDIISELPLSVAITPDLPITNSLIIEDEHLSTIPKKESDEFTKSITPLSDNEDAGFPPRCDVDEIEFLLHRDPSKISVDSILERFTDEPTLKENDDLFDLESKDNEWKKILYDASIDDLMTEDKIFDLGIPEKFFLSNNVKLPFCRVLKIITRKGQKRTTRDTEMERVPDKGVSSTKVVLEFSILWILLRIYNFTHINHSLHIPPHDSANNSVHNYNEAHDDNEETNSLRLGSFVDQSGRDLNADKTEVFLSSLAGHSAHHSPAAEKIPSPPKAILQEASSVDLPHFEWRSGELMVHLAPLAAQEESNALTNVVDLERAWFSLARGALAQTDILERVDLEHNAKLYNDITNQYKKVKEEHTGCANRLQVLEKEKNELSKVNRHQALRSKELEAELAKKDSALVYTERISNERAEEKEMEKFDCIRKLLPTVGLAKGRSEKDIMDALHKVENFDPYSDKKLYLMYDKLFEKQYLYVEKIARDFHHSVVELLRVHPDPAPSDKAPVEAALKAPTGLPVPSVQKKT